MGPNLQQSRDAVVLESNPREGTVEPPIMESLHASVLTTEVWPPPLAELGPSRLAGCHVGGDCWTEA